MTKTVWVAFDRDDSMRQSIPIVAFTTREAALESKVTLKYKNNYRVRPITEMAEVILYDEKTVVEVENE